MKASAANSRQLTCTGDKALYSRDQESPHKPKGEKTTVTIRKYQIQLQSYCKLCLLLFTTDLYSFHPPPQGLITPPLQMQKRGCPRSASCLGKYRQVEGPGHQRPFSLLEGCINLVVLFQMFAKSNRRCFPSWNFFSSSLHPASKGSSNMTHNWGIW